MGSIQDLVSYCSKLLKNLSYKVFLEKFTPKLSEVMTLIMEINKYADESLARSKILVFPTP